MKKILLYISFLFLSTSLFAQAKIGPDGNVQPTGNYPVVKNKDIQGALHSFKTIAERNALIDSARQVGMLAYVDDSTKYYKLIGGITNSDWQEWKGGNGGCPVTFYTTPDSIYLVKDSCGSIIDSTMWVGDTTGTSSSGIQSVVAGDNISIDTTDPSNPIINSTSTPPVQFQWSVIDSVNSVTSPSQGDIYLVSTSPSGAFVGHNNQIATYDTADGFTYTTATVGDLLYNATLQKVSKWNGTTWVRVRVDAYVHIDYPEKIIGKKTFADSVIAQGKPFVWKLTTGVSNQILVAKGDRPNDPAFAINVGPARADMTFRGTTAGAAVDVLRIVGDYKDTIISGAYRPLSIIANYELELKGGSTFISGDTAISFRNSSGYAGIVHNSGKWSFDKYASRAFYQNDTAIWKPMVMDNAGNIGQGSWVGGTAGSTPSLQSVSNIGYITSNPLISAGSGTQAVGAFNSTGTSGVQLLYDGTNSIIKWISATSFIASLQAPSSGTNSILTLPITTGTLAEGITNGATTVHAGTDGVIDISSIAPTITSGTSAPSSTPSKVGDIYVDITGKKLYFATGTSSSSDWTIAN